MSASLSIRIEADTRSGCNLYGGARSPILAVYGPGWYFNAYAADPDAEKLTEADVEAVRRFADAVAQFAADVERLVAEGRTVAA